MTTFGENLRAIRRSRGYTQEKFASMLDSNQANITAWERGSRIPPLSTIQEIARKLHVPMSALISIQATGKEEDVVREVTDIIGQNPKLKFLFDRVKLLCDEDLDAVIAIVNALTRDREDEE